MSNGPNVKERGKPTGKINVTMYNVGFGDCFLVAFPYTNGTSKHVLIDFGTSTENKDTMKKVAQQIANDCGHKLDAIVVTHRHKDHLSAFGLKDVGTILKSLNPEIVVRPWTDHPKAKAQAKSAPSVFTNAAVARLRSFKSAQKFVQQLIEDPGKSLPAASKQMQRSLAFIASLSIPNQPAINLLQSICKPHAYVFLGSKSGLDKKLPGVRVTVLGPPTLTQSDKIKHQTKWDKDEFWELQKRLLSVMIENKPGAKGRSVLFRGAVTTAVAATSSPVRWAINRLDRAHTQDIQRIVRALDNVLNNTSVILVFEVGKKALLFPGDAQLENWQYALQHSQKQNLLKTVNLYKVGHHGSTNATPKSLWALFRNRSVQAKPGRLMTLLSTKSGKHEKVPRVSLVKVFDKETNLYSTEKWDIQTKLGETFTL